MPHKHNNQPNLFQHQIKNELSRVRQSMMREKEIHDRKLRPLVDKAAAGRFIKHGINERKSKKRPADKPLSGQVNTKIRFTENDSD